MKVGYRLPLQLTKALEARAIAERRSINDQMIVLLEQALVEKDVKEK